MSTHELLELASLDALGLLTEEERAQYEAAFRAAAPTLQAQIRREQARFAAADAMLPKVEPPAGLRARVIAAVREAMQSVTGRSVAGRVGPQLAPSRGVSAFWRAGAIGSLAAALVLGAMNMYMSAEYEDLTTRLGHDAFGNSLVQEYGSTFDRALYNPATEFVRFSPDADDSSAQAVVVLDPSTGKGQLLCKNFPQNVGEFQLVLIDEQGNVAEAILTFKPAGVRHSGVFEKPRLVGSGYRMAVISASGAATDDEPPAPILKSQTL